MNKIKLCSLKNQSSYNEIIKIAAKYVCRYFVLYISKNHSNCNLLTKKQISETDKPILYGFKISKKYGKAVERNLLKRRLKNIYTLFFKNEYKPLSIVFIPRVQIKDLKFNELKEQIDKAINWYISKNFDNS